MDPPGQSFNSSDIEDDVPQSRFGNLQPGNAGREIRRRMADNSHEDRIASKKTVRNLGLTSGAPNVIARRKLVLGLWNEFCVSVGTE